MKRRIILNDLIAQRNKRNLNNIRKRSFRRNRVIIQFIEIYEWIKKQDQIIILNRYKKLFYQEDNNDLFLEVDFMMIQQECFQKMISHILVDLLEQNISYFQKINIKKTAVVLRENQSDCVVTTIPYLKILIQ
ncbi:unnamed protein product [Paramecium sonneborni]|uniref:Uncharacterized protein n=1 Tax=Paramecium sonneborni TaxID=65129 RepID=A0A8S1QT54_9CILI|nr:unnamed protein product [Paramecium sonneborni]